MSMDLRERTRALLRGQLADAILSVFLNRGYSAVTVDEAARGAGISRATFFRYFGSKEDVVVASVESVGVDYRAGLSAVAPDARLTGWELVRAAIEPVVVLAAREPERQRALLRLIGGEAALRTRLRERRIESAEALALALGERLGDRVRARILATAGLAAVDIAWEEWASQEDADFPTIVDAVFVQLAEAGLPQD